MQSGRLSHQVKYLHLKHQIQGATANTKLLFSEHSNMKSLVVCLSLAIAVASASTLRDEGKAQTVRYVSGYSEYNNQGTTIDLFNYSPDLALEGVDNAIYSGCSTGNWIVYDDANYAPDGGLSCWTTGISTCLPTLGECSGKISSVRYAGSPDGLNDDFINFYSGHNFTGSEVRVSDTALSIGELDNDVSSLIISGTSEWTFYTELQFEGPALCFGPQEHLTSTDGTVLDYAWVPKMADIGLTDNSIRSVMKGCIAGPAEMGGESKASD